MWNMWAKPTCLHSYGWLKVLTSQYKSLEELEDKLFTAFTGNPFNFGIKVAKDTKMGWVFFLAHILSIYWTIKKVGLLVVTISEKSHVKFNVS